MCTTPVNPTRVESLTSLLFRCAVGAASTKSGYFHPSNLCQSVNMRESIIKKIPKLAAGNIFIVVSAQIVNSDQTKLNEVITQLRKERMENMELRDVQEVGEKLLNGVLKLGDSQSTTYNSTSLCRFPLYEVDFGWGKPVQVMIRTANSDGNFFILMDTPSGDGIEALVHLEEEEMSIFQNDKELLEYVEVI